MPRSEIQAMTPPKAGPTIRAANAYVLVTPVRNEEQTIGQTIESVVAQTIRPREWVIVSDASTDRTDAIVQAHAERHAWLRLLRLANRPARGFASVVFVTEAGFRALTFSDYAFVGLLDADVRFGPTYFEQILARFASDPGLGLAGGLVVDAGCSVTKAARGHDGNVAGAVQFFRRECFESLHGLVPVPEGGWDALTCVEARQRGFRTVTFNDLVVDHLKPRNAAEGGVLRRHWQLGVRDRALGYHPLFMLAKCIYRIRESPVLLGAACRLAGYVGTTFRHRPRLVPPALVRFLRAEQMARLHLSGRHHTG